ncbi:hypothetical protein [Streptomyces litmocidini]|uniref:hypothetical protein n=1 Tax=Streptomyces litmocidini TaxID=67318 RepID=UPI003F54133D
MLTPARLRLRPCLRPAPTRPSHAAGTGHRRPGGATTGSPPRRWSCSRGTTSPRGAVCTAAIAAVQACNTHRDAARAGRARLEASGSITPDTARIVAETGVDTMSAGAITHSAPVFDLSRLSTPTAPAGGRHPARFGRDCVSSGVSELERPPWPPWPPSLAWKVFASVPGTFPRRLPGDPSPGSSNPSVHSKSDVSGRTQEVFHGQGLLGQCLPRHFRP